MVSTPARPSASAAADPIAPSPTTTARARSTNEPLGGRRRRGADVAPHAPDRWPAAGDRNLLHHPEPMPLVQPPVVLARRLEVGGDVLRVGPRQHVREERRAQTPVLVIRVRAEDRQVVV